MRRRGAIIADIADEEGADLIVAGTRGHGPLSGLLLGSVTYRLVQDGKRAILRPRPRDSVGRDRWRDNRSAVSTVIRDTHPARGAILRLRDSETADPLLFFDRISPESLYLRIANGCRFWSAWLGSAGQILVINSPV
jgi:hypothetical protein